MLKHYWIYLSIVGCGTSGSSDRIEITEPNELGVVAITSTRGAEGGDHTFMLEGFDAEGAVVARVQQKIGHIPDLNAHVPGDNDIGTEQIVGIGDQTWREITRETRAHTVPLFEPSTRYREFFLLDAVRTELAANQTLVGFGRDGGRGGERPFVTAQCGSSQLNVSPVADQCCSSMFTPYPDDPQSTQRYTEFKPESGNNAGLIVRRETSPYGRCKSWWGTACNGRDCTYGPNGSSTASIYTGTQSYAVVVQSQYDDESCGPEQDGTPSYDTTHGSFGTACGCSCDGAGSICLDTGSQAYAQGGTCSQAGTTCVATGCSSGGGGGADQWAY